MNEKIDTVDCSDSTKVTWFIDDILKSINIHKLTYYFME
jgi:hypothetical protein